MSKDFIGGLREFVDIDKKEWINLMLSDECMMMGRAMSILHTILEKNSMRIVLFQR